MTAWYRAASMALAAHFLVLTVFMFTVKGSAAAYKVDVVFWGGILRPQEVALAERPSGVVLADVRDVNVPGVMRQASLLWARGVEIDKPDLFRNILAPGTDGLLRFSGERVELDEAKPAPVDADIPAVAPVKMRLQRP